MNINTFERKTFLNNPLRDINNNSVFNIESKNDSLIVSVNLLRATANEAEELKEYLNGLTITEESSVIIDLSKTTFIDSTFLSTIVSFNKKNKFKKDGIKLIVKDPRQSAILRITKIDTIFKIYSTLEEAV
jgi:anti-anti-sigma factor